MNARFLPIWFLLACQAEPAPIDHCEPLAISSPRVMRIAHPETGEPVFVLSLEAYKALDNELVAYEAWKRECYGE